MLRKLLATPGIAGAQMPIGLPLDAASIRTISDWIETGANP
jgi:hypothetical protein